MKWMVLCREPVGTGVRLAVGQPVDTGVRRAVGEPVGSGEFAPDSQ